MDSMTKDEQKGRSIRHVACLDLRGVPSAITMGEDDEVRTWDLRSTGQSHPPIHAGKGAHFALAVLEIEGEAHAVTASVEGISMWAIRTGTRRWGPLEVHPLPIDSLCVATRKGRAVIVTRSAADLAYDGEGAYGYGGIVNVWEPTNGSQIGEPIEVEELGLVAACGEALLITSHASAHVLFENGQGDCFDVQHDRRLITHATFDKGSSHDLRVITADPYSVWVWDARTGKTLGDVLSTAKPSYETRIVGVASVASGRVVVGRDAGILEIWDIDHRRQVDTVSCGRPIASLGVTHHGMIVAGHHDGSLSKFNPIGRGT
jgi:WD40 repeat protein